MLAFQKRFKDADNKMNTWIWMRSFVATKYVILGLCFTLFEAYSDHPQNRDKKKNPLFQKVTI